MVFTIDFAIILVTRITGKPVRIRLITNKNYHEKDLILTYEIGKLSGTLCIYL